MIVATKEFFCKIDASLICRPYLQNNHYNINRHCTYSGVTLFVTKPHFSPNRNIGPNYCTMLMLATKHRHDDHSRLSSSGNLFFDVWHNLPFKKEGLLCCFLEWKRL